MSQTYNASLTMQLIDQLIDNDGVVSSTDSLTTGGSNFAKLDHSLANGSGANKANKRFRTLGRVLLTGANDDWVLSNGINVKYKFQNVINFTLIKWLILRIPTPAAGVKLLIGNAVVPWQGWFQTNTYSEYVQDLLIRCEQVDGWPVTPNQTFRVNNPTANPITYDLIIAGEG